ncbi:hypothetical protein [Desulfopila inferna]|uniref:hypothetical protein n=1 Tax=Desulfopila inferna TaxID=468528 RepID=UPI001962358A|nr:hypothetical protein [Desulfopila inferna]MBM9605948.1 hypothetical protein [Desulfopila inferna]
MKLICPGCGAVASAETWSNDELCRETLLVISRLPAPLPKATLGYLSLFRPGKQALTWKKALRLALEIEQLVAAGYVHVQGKIDRTCPPSLWGKAMEQMVEQRGSLRLSMASHIYLAKIAWDLAEQADYGTEKKKTTILNRPKGNADPMLDPMEKARREYDERMKRGEVSVDLNNVSGIVKGMD